MKRAALAAAMLCASVLPAFAEPGSVPDNTETLLHLSVVGTVRQTPDLLTADLTGTETAGDPATAQRRLDARMKTATTTAGSAKDVDWQVEGYAVDQSAPDGNGGRSPWTAQQTLHLQSGDADALLALVGRLQAMGLAVGSLQWVLSPARRLAAEQQASAAALRLLRDRAGAAAATLGLRVDTIRSVTLSETGGSPPRPLMRMMMAGAPAPQATRSETVISQDAEGEIALKP